MRTGERHPSYQVSGVVASLERIDAGGAGAGGSSQVHPVLNVTRNGCYLQASEPQGVGQVKFLKDGRTAFEKRCELARSDTPKGFMALRFTSELNDGELRKLGVTSGETEAEKAQQRLALAREDCRAISSDIDGIQKCRSRIFVATTGTITVAAFTIWATHLKVSLAPYALCTGMAGVFSVFSVGVLTMAGKGRAINARRGFLAALMPYLNGDKELKRYYGWAQLQDCLTKCGGLRRAKRCGLNVDYDSARACRDEGEASAVRISSYLRLVPGGLDSFTSLSTLFYTIAYVAFMGLFGYAFSIALSEYWVVIDVSQSLRVFFCGALFISFLYRWLRIVALVLASGLVVVGAVWGDWLWGVINAFGVGALLGSLGWYLSAQLYALRLGKYSFETNAYAWGRVLKYCEPLSEAEVLNDATIQTREETGWERLCGWVRTRWLANVGQRTHQQVEQDLKKAHRPGESRTA